MGFTLIDNVTNAVATVNEENSRLAAFEHKRA